MICLLSSKNSLMDFSILLGLLVQSISVINPCFHAVFSHHLVGDLWSLALNHTNICLCGVGWGGVWELGTILGPEASLLSNINVYYQLRYDREHVKLLYVPVLVQIVRHMVRVHHLFKVTCQLLDTGDSLCPKSVEHIC